MSKFNASSSFKSKTADFSASKSNNVNWFRQTPELMEESKNSTRISKSKYFRTDLVSEFKLKDYKTDGINKIRILPINFAIWPDAKNFGMLVWVHPNLGENFETHLCPEKMKKGACPICEHSRFLAESGTKADIKQSDKLKPKLKIIYLLVDRNDEDGEVLFTAASWWKIGLAIHNLQTNPEDGSIRQIVDPNEGRDILIHYNKPPKNASNQDLQNIYPPNCVSLSERITALDNDKALDFVAKNAIPNLVVYTPYEELQKVLFGDSETTDDIIEQRNNEVSNESTTISNNDITAEQVREMTDDELSQILRNNNVPESDIEDMTSAEKRKMIRDNLNLN